MGTYCGYSAITLLACLRPNDKLVAIESDIDSIRWTSQMLSKAGYQVKVFHSGDVGSTAESTADADLLLLHGTAASCIESGRLAAVVGSSRVDVLLMDHQKTAYLPDLKSLQQSRLLAQTALVVAGVCMNVCVCVCV